MSAMISRCFVGEISFCFRMADRSGRLFMEAMARI